MVGRYVLTVTVMVFERVHGSMTAEIVTPRILCWGEGV